MERHKYHQLLSRDLPSVLQQGAILIDVRRAEEWQLTGVVAGSHLLTFFDAKGDCRPAQWCAQLDSLAPPERPLVLICRTGQRTTLICELLVEKGYQGELYNVSDGIFGWLAEGLPVVSIKP